MEVILREDVDKAGNARPDGESDLRLRAQLPAAQKTGRGGHRGEQEDRRAGTAGASAPRGKVGGRCRRLGQNDGGCFGHNFAESRRKRSAVRLGDLPRTSSKRSSSKGYTIDRRKIALEEPIKTLGEFKVTVRLHREVPAEITVRVVREEE